MRTCLIGRKVSVAGPFGAEYVGTVLDESVEETPDFCETTWCWVEWRGIRRASWFEADRLTVVP